jgi:hypothetical protein
MTIPKVKKTVADICNALSREILSLAIATATVAPVLDNVPMAPPDKKVVDTPSGAAAVEEFAQKTDRAVDAKAGRKDKHLNPASGKARHTEDQASGAKRMSNNQRNKKRDNAEFRRRLQKAKQELKTARITYAASQLNQMASQGSCDGYNMRKGKKGKGLRNDSRKRSNNEDGSDAVAEPSASAAASSSRKKKNKKPCKDEEEKVVEDNN